MSVPHSQYHEVGQVTLHRDLCTSCGQCAKTCPAEVLIMNGDALEVNEHSPFGCIACGHCMMVCPTAGITVTGRGLDPSDLRPIPSRDVFATADALEALMRSRRSIRRFHNEPVEPTILDRIVAMAEAAPMGIPPWDVGCVVINGTEKVQELAEDVIKGYERMLKIFRPWVLTLMRPLMGRSKYEQLARFIVPLARMLIATRRAGRDTLFWDAPAVMVFHRSSYLDDAEAMIPCTYAILAAESLGLGTTMIGSSGPIIARDKALSAKLGIPKNHKPNITMTLGHPAIHFRKSIHRRFGHINMV